MATEINNTTTILHSLQTKVDQLELVNKELEKKLLKQDENIERLLANFNFQKSDAIVPAVKQEEEQLLQEKEDPEQALFSHSSEANKEDKNKLTIEKSIHNLPFVNILGKETIQI